MHLLLLDPLYHLVSLPILPVQSEKASPTAVPPPQPDKKEPPPSIKPKPKAPGSETLPPTKPSPPIAQKPLFDRRAQSLSGPKEVCYP